MENVSVVGIYIMEGYTLYKVKPLGFINYGTNKYMYCFNYASLAVQWGIGIEVLDEISSYNISLKQSMFVSFIETEVGLVKTYMMDAKAVPSLLRKLKDSANRPTTDINREHAVLAMLIDNAKGYGNGTSKSNIG
ncbi:hypothetical protein HGO21_12475 [Acinetobacter sp. CUI P1]|nr:hypothetical protein [Acinetobacter sp. CUI P1]